MTLQLVVSHDIPAAPVAREFHLRTWHAVAGCLAFWVAAFAAPQIVWPLVASLFVIACAAAIVVGAWRR